MPEITGVAAEVAARLDHLDKTVEEVFGMMMGISCAPVPNPPAPTNEVTAVIGLAGSLSGAYIINVSNEGALRVAAALMGTPSAEVDDMVKDSIGEVCNMLSGAWKGRFPELASACMLSVPTIVTGKDFKLHMQKPLVRIERIYGFEGHSMTVNIMCEA